MRKPPKNRAWRKLHLAVDANTGDVVACDLGSSKARDAARGRALLKQVEQPLASAAAAMSRYKTIIGPVVRPRTLQGQRVEARIGCQILNRMTSLGMPESHRVD
jgi:hypothetical protein